MAKTLEELQLQNERLIAVEECRTLMSGYMIWGGNFRWLKYLPNWAEREDAQLCMPWGIYDGKSGVVECYTKDHLDSTNEGFPENVRGSLCSHNQNTECIVVAEDGKTARGVWCCTGTEQDGWDTIAESCAGWCFGKYDVDFIKEDGRWKILHMHLYPIFLIDFARSWIWQMPYIGLGAMDSVEGTHEEARVTHTRPLTWENYQINKDALYPVDRPAVPKPYKTFDDVAPGYGEKWFGHDGNA